MCCVFFASCDQLPPELMEDLGPVLEKLGVMNHEHNFTLTETVDPTCTEKGSYLYTCECGETKNEEFGEPLGHKYELVKEVAPTCKVDGSRKMMCYQCMTSKSEPGEPATGHNIAAFIEISRLQNCTNKNCPYAVLPKGDGKYEEVIVYKFTESDIADFEATWNELDGIISAADPYDATLHGYLEGSDTHLAYQIMEAKYEELYDILEYVTAQYQIAQVEYHVSMGDKTKKANFEYISEVRTDLVADFYIFSEPIYNSMYREYYYEGMTEQEILAFIFESNAVSNAEYKALVDRNNEIELEFNETASPETGDEVPNLYAEFVENNKKIAALMGYDNYVEYAYENVYDRDYSYQDVQELFGYVKEYISPVYNKIYGKWNSITANLSATSAAYKAYETYIMDSFFTNYKSNKLLNDYIDNKEMGFTSESGKKVSFSDELNNLMGDGNLFRGTYDGAYVTNLYGMDLPIAYFGKGSYSNCFTVAHEFGHYMNEIYSGGKFSQSFDLLEMHSQGNEMLYLAYIKGLNGVIPADGVEFIETFQVLNMLDITVRALVVDIFEQAVYTDTYTGTYSDEIMKDGKITADEYDRLFLSIATDLGVDKYVGDTYWRYVTISSPCYYISYSVSALSVLQLYPMAIEDYDEAKDSYLKLFTYVDEYESEDNYEYMTTEETLQYAGLLSFKDEELYKYINKYFMTALQ